MIKKFFSYSAAEGLSKGLNWLTIALLPLVLNPKEYGIVGLLVAIEGMVSSITLIGQEKAIFRFYDPKKFNVLKYAFQLITICVALLMVGLGGFAIFKQSLFSINIFPHLIVFLVSIFFYNQARLLMSYSRITEDAALFWKTRALYQLIKIVLVVVLCSYFKTGISYIYGCLITGVVFFVIYFKLIVKNYHAPGKIATIDNVSIMLLGFGFPLVFHAMSGNILTYADRFFVQGFLDSKQLGIYTFVYSLSSSIFFFYGTVASYFEPLTYRYHDNKAAYQSVLKFYLVFVLIFAGLMAFAIKLAFKPVILHLVSHDYSLGADCLIYILAGYLMIPFYTIANYELAVISKTKFIAVSTVLSAIFNVTMNYFIIRKLGIVGAAISTFSTYLFLAFIVNFYSRVKAGLDLKYLAFVTGVFLMVLSSILLILYLKTNFVILTALVLIVLAILSYLAIVEYKALRKYISADH